MDFFEMPDTIELELDEPVQPLDSIKCAGHSLAIENTHYLVSLVQGRRVGLIKIPSPFLIRDEPKYGVKIERMYQQLCHWPIVHALESWMRRWHEVRLAEFTKQMNADPSWNAFWDRLGV